MFAAGAGAAEVGDAERRQIAEAELLEQIRAEDWPVHIQALYEEIAALSTALGMPTPRLKAAGLDAGGPGTILASFQQLAMAVKQVQGIAVVNEARTRALLDICCRIAPSQRPMFQVAFDVAGDLAKQESDPDKVAARSKGGIITN